MTLRALFWRGVYALLWSTVTVRLAVVLLRLYGRMRGPATADGLLALIDRRLVSSGWPVHERGWTNLHASRWITSVRHGLDSRPAVTPRRRPRGGAPVRVACVGRFAGLLGFPSALLAACPNDLVVADIAFAGGHVPVLAAAAAAYAPFNWDDASTREAEVDRVARFLRDQDTGLLVNIGYKRDFQNLLDRLDVPCIANLCVGSDLLHHPKVDIQLHGQPEADYFEVDGRMFCGTTASSFGPTFVHSITGYMDPRGLALVPGRPWSAREPLVVCHGSLYKFGRPSFLDVVCRLLAEDATLELVLMGKDDGQALACIEAHATRWEVSSRVHYLGQFSAVRSPGADVTDPGWERMVDLLGRARLAPDPFPIGGGSARFEAYALGTPTVHMGVRFHAEAWGRPQPGLCEIPSLRTRQGTAFSLDEYAALCRRCLGDGTFADALAAEQLRLAQTVADPRRWWSEVLAGYEVWLGRPRPAEKVA